MADKVSTWALKLEDQTSGAAQTAAEALSKLESQITADTKALGGMQRALKNLQGATKPNATLIDDLKKKIASQKESIAKAQSSYIGLGGSFAKTASSGRGLDSKFSELAAKLKEMPGPTNGVIGTLSKLRAMLVPPTIATGIAAIGAAMLALVGAAGAATRALYKYGVAQADARRSELLHLEGLTKMRFLFARAPGDAKGMQEALDRVAAKVPASRAELAKYGDQLYRMGARGAQWEKALEGVGIKLGTQGEAAASSFAAFAGGAAITGRSVDKLVDRVKNRLGGLAQRQMSSLTMQTIKQKEAFDALFSGLDIEKYLGAWKDVKDLLSQSTASGRALKGMLTSILQPLINSSTQGAPLIKRFFQGIIIGALQLTIVILRVRNWFKRTFGERELFKGLDWGNVAVKLGTGLVFALAAAFVPLVALLTPFALGLYAAAARMSQLWDAGKRLVDFFERTDFGKIGLDMIDGLTGFFDKLVSQWEELGGRMIDGLVKGLSIEPIVKRVGELADEAVGVFKKALEISSPSKVFERVGVAIPQGVAAGVNEGAPDAQRASSNMVRASTPELGPMGAGGGAPEPPPAGAARGGGKAGPAKIEIGEINVYASSDEPKQMALDFRRELEAVLEGLSLEIGSPVPS